jgi:hypothetical protein
VHTPHVGGKQPMVGPVYSGKKKQGKHFMKISIKDLLKKIFNNKAEYNCSIHGKAQKSNIGKFTFCTKCFWASLNNEWDEKFLKDNKNK